jgi:hypothetical protein
MSTRTFLMMLALLAFNWGGFLCLLLYGATRDPRRGRRPTGH